VRHPHGRPPEINGHIPDIAAYSDNSLYIIAEAETCDTVTDSDTREQWETFRTYDHPVLVLLEKLHIEWWCG